MSHIYHLLDEAEPFSEFSGGAISRWVANVLKSGDETIICQSFDDSWGYPAKRLFRLPRWNRCNQVHPAIYRSPWMIQKPIYMNVFRPVLERLKKGDILYIHNRPEIADVLASIAQHRGFRLVLHMHNSLLHPRTRKHIPRLKDIPIVFCSEFLRREATSAYPDHLQRTHVVYNGADSDKFRAEVRAKKKSVSQIIYTGRLIPNKGVHVLLDAMRILERKGVSAKCTIVGGSAFGKSKQTRYVQELERTRPGNTELIGYRAGNEFADLLRNADIFCCPSIWNDPFPMSLLEAMSSGLPVVASNMGGIPEQLAHGGGVLVPPDNKEALATVLQQLLDDDSYRQRLAGEALKASRNFVWGNTRQQYDSFIRGLAS
jgi:spore coat protein SA